MPCHVAAIAPTAIAGSPSGASVAVTSWGGSCGRLAAGRTTRSSPIGRSFLFSGGLIRRARSSLLAFCAWAAGLAGFFAVEDTARHLIPQVGAACLLIGLLCAARRLWLGGTVWVVTAAIALWPIIPN